MATYRVYNENYNGFNEQDLESVDFVELDDNVIHCINIYDPAVREHLNIVNVKVGDIPRFVKRNKILTPSDFAEQCALMQPYQYKHKFIEDEIEADKELETFDKLHGENNMGCDISELTELLNDLSDKVSKLGNKNNDSDDFFERLNDAEKCCPTAMKANEHYKKELKEAWNAVPTYNGFEGNLPSTADNCLPATASYQPVTIPMVTRTCGYLNNGENMIDRETLHDYCSSGIALAPSTFDDTPKTDFNIDVDSIFTSQPKSENTIDVTDLDKISIDNSTLLQGSCLDMFNNTVENFEEAKFREPEHTSPAKLEKQRRIEEYHKRHNRRRER